MDMQKYLSHWKISQKSNFYSSKKCLRIYTDKEHKRMTITDNGVVKIELTMKNGKLLTQFEGSILVSIFCDHQLPLDYASWHKTKAAQDFIENIEHISRYIPRTIHVLEEVF